MLEYRILFIITIIVTVIVSSICEVFSTNKALFDFFVTIIVITHLGMFFKFCSHNLTALFSEIYISNNKYVISLNYFATIKLGKKVKTRKNRRYIIGRSIYLNFLDVIKHSSNKDGSIFEVKTWIIHGKLMNRLISHGFVFEETKPNLLQLAVLNMVYRYLHGTVDGFNHIKNSTWYRITWSSPNAVSLLCSIKAESFTRRKLY